MASPPSKIVHAAWTDELVGVPAFHAFGDPDDGLRLTTLLADGLSPDAPSAQEEVRACKTPKLSWEQRLDALQIILKRASRPQRRPFLGALIDLDALDPGPLRPSRLWKDRGFGVQRAALLEILVDAIDRGGWLVLRPNPRRKLLDRVRAPEASTGDLPATSDPELRAVMREIDAELRPTLAWLVERKGRLEVASAREVLDEGGPEELATYTLMLAYELLKPSVQRAGQRLSALRGPQAVNGTIGGFLLVGGGPTVAFAVEALGGLTSVDATAVEALEACGFLQPVDPRRGRASLQMPSPVRAFLRRLARLEVPEQWSKVNAALGGRPLEGLPIHEQLEVHHQAVEGGDLAQARRTALYYGADLRGLAFRMSQEERFGDAANVYAVIVEEFDPEDAYAWEYLGYNLAREVHRRAMSGGEPRSREESARILKAYEIAAEKAKMNPLYDGRLLGFQAEIGN